MTSAACRSVSTAMTTRWSWTTPRTLPDDAPDTLNSIRHKVAYYLDVIEVAEFQAEMGYPPRDRISIILRCDHPISPRAAEVIAECQTSARKRGVRLEVQQKQANPCCSQQGAFRLLWIHLVFQIVRVVPVDQVVRNGQRCSQPHAQQPAHLLRGRDRAEHVSIPAGEANVARGKCNSHWWRLHSPLGQSTDENYHVKVDRSTNSRVKSKRKGQ